jgi:hypothetical protein
MKATFKNEVAAVFDDVFEPDIYKYFISFFNSQNFAFRSSGPWHKIWKINDGEFLAGQEVSSTQMPLNNPYDWLYAQIHGLATNHLKDIVGEEGKDWCEIAIRPYIYPAGTKISWHDDYGYTAACIFYCHQEWNPFWGGELMLATTPPHDVLDKTVGHDDNINRLYSKQLLNHYGFGMYFSPNPNRLLFTKGGVWHAINRVDQSAGDNIRASVVAFFRKTPCQPNEQPSQS